MYMCEKCGMRFSTSRSLGGHSNIHRNSDVKLTDLQQQIILGSLLGDMWIYKNGHSKLNPEVGVKHSSKQRDYILWKYDILRNIARGFPIEFPGSGYGKGTTMLQFSSKSLQCLNSIYNATHPFGRKHVTTNWLEMINHPIAIAVWFMDDGCRNNAHQASIALGRSESNACSLLQLLMKDRWDIDTVVHTHIGKVGSRDITQTYLHFNKKPFDALRTLIKPYIIPSMMYKIR
jgi:hypothetical protein